MTPDRKAININAWLSGWLSYTHTHGARHLSFCACLAVAELGCSQCSGNKILSGCVRAHFSTATRLQHLRQHRTDICTVTVDPFMSLKNTRKLCSHRAMRLGIFDRFAQSDNTHMVRSQKVHLYHLVPIGGQHGQK